MSKYTKGPWITYRDRDGNHKLRDENNKSIGLIWEEADASLIAAAPELLKALKMMVATGVPVGGFGEAAYERSVAVIAKAEGL